MPRNMSFQMTTEQYRRRTKTVTRRLGWNNVKIGEVLNGVEKCQGLKKGEKMIKLGQHRVVGFRKEPLNAITHEECVLEGFPHLTPEQFVQMFVEHNKCLPDTTVNRIEYEYL
jgi:hypothetical protein